MKFIPVVLASLVLLALPCNGLGKGAGPRPQPNSTDSAVPAKSSGDSTVVMGGLGSGARYIGSFEGPFGGPDANGWTSRDLTARTEPVWHASTNAPLSGSYSAWCGENSYMACNESDTAGGYGNFYDEALVWRLAVTDTARATTVRIQGTASYDVEPGYDYCHLGWEANPGQGSTTYIDAWSVTGKADAIQIDETFTVPAQDYGGVGGNELVVVIRVETDFSWSDEDCLWPTGGAMRLDDVLITTDNGGSVSHDFEDGTLGPLEPRLRRRVGDFTAIRDGLPDIDPCRDNGSHQLSFFDDGLVVPGTGGSDCLSWCYGPGGYVVNTTGGLAGPQRHLAVSVESPVMPWSSSAHDAATLWLDAYLHNADVSGGFDVFGALPAVHVRSTADADPDAIASAPWRELIESMMGLGTYRTFRFDLAPYLVEDPRHVQVRITTFDARLSPFGALSVSGESSPAPYIDNVQFVTHPSRGPAIALQKGLPAQSSFPAIGFLDTLDLARGSVRFDRVRPEADGLDTETDRILVTTAPGSPDAVFGDAPSLRYRLKRNPLFDAFRTSGAPDEGTVPCTPYGPGTTIAGGGTWAVDLPDSGFLFPGDRLHYCFTVSETASGMERPAILPADTTGFSDLSPGSLYDLRFVMRGLPGVTDNPATRHPSLLLWHGQVYDHEEYEAWANALRYCLQLPGLDYDVITTNAQQEDHGLQYLATPASLDRYDTIIFTSGRSQVSFSHNRYASASSDLELLETWLNAGGRNLIVCGDNVLSGVGSIAPMAAFMADRLGVELVARDMSAAVPDPAELVFSTENDGRAPVADRLWSAVVESACPDPRSLDAIAPLSGVPLGELAIAGGGTPLPFAPGVLTLSDSLSNRALTYPFGLTALDNDPDETPSAWARTVPASWRLVYDIMAYLDYPVQAAPVTPSAAGLIVRSYPNPFNASVTFDFAPPRPGRLRLAIYDLRGSLVRVLFDGAVPADSRLEWNGRDSRGRTVSSGTYFYEARYGGEARWGKLTLLK